MRYVNNFMRLNKVNVAVLEIVRAQSHSFKQLNMYIQINLIRLTLLFAEFKRNILYMF